MSGIKAVSLDSGVTDEGTVVYVLRVETVPGDTHTAEGMEALAHRFRGEVSGARAPAPAPGPRPVVGEGEDEEEYGTSNLQRKEA